MNEYEEHVIPAKAGIRQILLNSTAVVVFHLRVFSAPQVTVLDAIGNAPGKGNGGNDSFKLA